MTRLGKSPWDDASGPGTDIVPTVDNAFDLGKPDKRFRNVYVGGSIIPAPSGAALLARPSGVVLTNPSTTANVYKTANGVYYTDYDPQLYRPVSANTYYVSPTGLSGNAGTLSSPTNMVHAYTLCNAGDTIMYLPGEYDRSAGFGANVSKDLNLVAYSGGVYVTGWNSALTWSVQSGNIYKATRSGVIQVIDKLTANITSWGDYQVLTNAASLGAMVAGSWFTDNVTIYVWPTGNRSLVGDTSIKCGISVPGLGAQVSGDVSVYIEGINFEGAGKVNEANVFAIGSSTTIKPKVICKNCTFKYVRNNGLGSQGAYITNINGLCSSNYQDGFNYHDASAFGSEFLEINCTSYYNGQDSQDTNGNCNGSTSHDGVQGTRINTITHHDRGPEIIDVIGARTWNLGCQTSTSLAPVANYGFDQYTVPSATPTIMYLDGCSTTSCTYAVACATDIMYTRDFRAISCTNFAFLSSGGTIVNY